MHDKSPWLLGHVSAELGAKYCKGGKKKKEKKRCDYFSLRPPGVRAPAAPRSTAVGLPGPGPCPAAGRSARPKLAGSRSRVMTDRFILYCLSELKYYLWLTVPSKEKKKRKGSLTELTQALLLGQ